MTKGNKLSESHAKKKIHSRNGLKGKYKIDFRRVVYYLNAQT